MIDVRARDAAVRAVAEALCGDSEYRCGVCDNREFYLSDEYHVAAMRVIAALATSADVRAGLVEHTWGEMVSIPSLYDLSAAERAVDAVLAALGGGA